MDPKARRTTTNFRSCLTKMTIRITNTEWEQLKALKAEDPANVWVHYLDGAPDKVMVRTPSGEREVELYDLPLSPYETSLTELSDQMQVALNRLGMLESDPSELDLLVSTMMDVSGAIHKKLLEVKAEVAYLPENTTVRELYQEMILEQDQRMRVSRDTTALTTSLYKEPEVLLEEAQEWIEFLGESP